MTMDVVFFWGAFWLYLLAFVLFSLYLAFKSERITKLATIAMIVGFVPHTVAIAFRWHLAGHPPLTNMYEYMSLMSWMAVLSFLFILWRFKRAVLGVFIAPVTVVLMVCASLLPKEISQQLVPALQSVWLQIHVSLAALGEGGFAVAFGASVMYLIRGRMQPSEDPKAFVNRFPSLELLDEVNYRAVSIGYPMFTVGALFAGAIWAHQAWGSWWSWDPKETGALIIWFFYTIYLHARYQRGWRGSKAAWMSIIGFVMTLLSFFGNLILGGLHAYL